MVSVHTIVGKTAQSGAGRIIVTELATASSRDGIGAARQGAWSKSGRWRHLARSRPAAGPRGGCCGTRLGRQAVLTVFVLVLFLCLVPATVARADSGSPLYVAKSQVDEDLAWANVQMRVTGPAFADYAAELDLERLLLKAGVPPDQVVQSIRDTRALIARQSGDGAAAIAHAAADAGSPGSSPWLSEPAYQALGDSLRQYVDEVNSWPQDKRYDWAAEKVDVETVALQGLYTKLVPVDPFVGQTVIYTLGQDVKKWFQQKAEAAREQSSAAPQEGDTAGNDAVAAQARADFDAQRDAALDGDQAAATVDNALHEPMTDEPLTASGDQTLAGNPDLRTDVASEGVLDPGTGTIVTESHDGVDSVEFDPATLQDDAKAALDGTTTTDDAIQTSAADLNAGQTAGGESFAQYVQDPQKQQQAQPKADADAATHEQELAADRATVTLLSDLIGTQNPELARGIATVGTATINIGESLNQWSETVGSLGAAFSSPVALLNTATMVSNALGSIQSVIGLFTGAQPPDQIILDQIKQVEDQITKLSTNMNARFDRVDQQLNTIFATVTNDFAHLSSQVQQVQADIARVAQNVDQIGRDLQLLAAATAREPLEIKMAEALDYTAKHPGAPPMSSQQFAEYEDDFAYWAQQLAKEPTVNLTPGHDNPLQLAAQLSTLPAEGDVNYLSEVAGDQLGTPGLLTTDPTQHPLPNPLEWQRGAEGYAILAAQWPQYAANDFSPQTGHNLTLDALIAEGQDIQANLQHISTSTTLFPALFDRYRNDLTQLATALKAESDTLLKASVPGGAEAWPALLWGPPDQTLPPNEQPFSLSRGVPLCDWLDDPNFVTSWPPNWIQDPYLAVPANVSITRMLPPQALMAARLGLGQARICWEAQFVNMHGSDYGEINIRVLGQYGANPAKGARVWQTLRKLAYTSPNVDYTCPCDRLWAECWVRQDWNGNEPPVKAEFGQYAQYTDVDPATEALLLNTVADQQVTLRKQWYDGMANAFTTGGSYHTANLETTADLATVLDGDKQLIVDYIQLGFPQALGADDILRSLVEGPAVTVDTDANGNQTISPDGGIIGCSAGSTPACADLHSWLAESQPNGQSPLGGPDAISLLKTDGLARIDTLENRITGYQQLLSTSEYQESNPLTNDTLRLLELERIALVPLPAPTTPPSPPPTPPSPAPSAPGTTASGIQGVTTLASPPSVTGGNQVSVIVRCAHASCRVQATETLTETLQGKRVVSVSATGGRRGRYLVNKTVTIATTTITIPADATRKITLKLNAAGRIILARFATLPVQLTVSQRQANGKLKTIETIKLALKRAPAAKGKPPANKRH